MQQQQRPAAGGERYSYVPTFGPGGSISGVRRVPASSLPYNYTIPPDILFDEDLAQDLIDRGRSSKRARADATTEAIEQGLVHVAGASRSGEDCPVCLQDFNADETLRAMPCAHAFHYHCISQWLRRNASCPLCRHQLLLVMPDDHDDKDQHQSHRRRTTT
ncbi:hypothetical protein HU200_064557 [Digitaria exilis]|uniref:RING-type domain-containing protein n=1 Tax=Digitaria exilis TaxID=1010633 RepID=A0A835DUG7_9POAL|nr:hypothetical protein HU200_064557 [Digitaria exilis]CAB3490765.1 unnamed protein product [Digitaria exilis]